MQFCLDTSLERGCQPADLYVQTPVIDGMRSRLRPLFFSGFSYVIVCALDSSGTGEDLEQSARVLVRGV